jgi:hypothetical protein
MLGSASKYIVTGQKKSHGYTAQYSERREEGGETNDKRQDAKSFGHTWKHDEDHEVSSSGRNMQHMLHFRQLHLCHKIIDICELIILKSCDTFTCVMKSH